jgi:hypothetical protein
MGESDQGLSNRGFHRRAGTRDNGGSSQRRRRDHRHYSVLEVWESLGCVALAAGRFLVTFFGLKKVTKNSRSSMNQWIIPWIIYSNF